MWRLGVRENILKISKTPSLTAAKATESICLPIQPKLVASFQCQCGIWKVGLMTVRSKSHFVSKRHRRKGAHVYPFAGEVAFSTVNNRWFSTFIGISLIEFYEVFAEIGIECRRRFNFICLLTSMRVIIASMCYLCNIGS
jgi:hypothetical protein